MLYIHQVTTIKQGQAYAHIWLVMGRLLQVYPSYESELKHAWNHVDIRLHTTILHASTIIHEQGENATSYLKQYYEI